MFGAARQCASAYLPGKCGSGRMGTSLRAFTIAGTAQPLQQCPLDARGVAGGPVIVPSSFAAGATV
jgi:hypothetical protein